ncbi:hypothetical protein G7Y79_00050g086040 [Physcia stellaris]|nr:hypothetical protein G7Y79_00050g086040 [Physcia stellaris]
MPEKKRKRESNGKAERPLKKVAVADPSTSGTVKFSLLQDTNEWTPLLAATPGFSLPLKTVFKPYTKPRSQTPQSSLPSKELLLHNSTHPKLDYVAREEETEKGQELMKHYIGLYDPTQETLQLVPARKVIVRSTLKASTAPLPQSDDETDAPNDISARNTLGLTFGTKKSQKAIRSLTENAISPSKTKAGGALDAAANVVMDSMAASTADMPSREEMQAEVTSNKPIPTPNLEAETPAEVYTLDSLVGLQALRSMQVKEWIDKENAGEEVTTRSRFVSSRIAGLVKADEVKKLKALKYLLLLVQWYLALRKGKSMLLVPKKEGWEKVLPGWDKESIAAVGRRFTERGGFELNKWHANLLLTHVLAIALVIDNFNIDTHDIREDLRLDHKEVSTLFAELGAPLTPPTEAELKKLKLSKTDAKKSGHHIARLKLPLKFPKMRILGARGSRR